MGGSGWFGLGSTAYAKCTRTSHKPWRSKGWFFYFLWVKGKCLICVASKQTKHSCKMNASSSMPKEKPLHSHGQVNQPQIVTASKILLVLACNTFQVKETRVVPKGGSSKAFWGTTSHWKAGVRPLNGSGSSDTRGGDRRVLPANERFFFSRQKVLKQPDRSPFRANQFNHWWIPMKSQ